MITTDPVFTEYLDKTVWKQDKEIPTRDELIQLETAFMSKLGEVKSQRNQDGSYRYLYSVYGRQVMNRLGYLSKIKDEGNDILDIRCLLSSYTRLRDALRAMDIRLFKSELGPILKRNKMEHEKRIREKAKLSASAGSSPSIANHPMDAVTPQPPVEPPKVLSGTQEFADYIGCSKTMAFSIIKSGILKEDAIQYKVGRCWKFHRERLDKYLADNPEILGRIRCKTPQNG